MPTEILTIDAVYEALDRCIELPNYGVCVVFVEEREDRFYRIFGEFPIDVLSDTDSRAKYLYKNHPFELIREVDPGSRTALVILHFENGSDVAFFSADRIRALGTFRRCNEILYDEDIPQQFLESYLQPMLTAYRLESEDVTYEADPGAPITIDAAAGYQPIRADLGYADTYNYCDVWNPYTTTTITGTTTTNAWRTTDGYGVVRDAIADYIRQQVSDMPPDTFETPYQTAARRFHEWSSGRRNGKKNVGSENTSKQGDSDKNEALDDFLGSFSVKSD